jgi:hypothetical protein
MRSMMDKVLISYEILQTKDGRFYWRCTNEYGNMFQSELFSNPFDLYIALGEYLISPPKLVAK